MEHIFQAWDSVTANGQGRWMFVYSKNNKKTTGAGAEFLARKEQ